MMSSDSYMATPVFGSTCNRRVSYITISTEMILLSSHKFLFIYREMSEEHPVSLNKGRMAH